MAQAMLCTGMDFCLTRLWNSYCIQRGYGIDGQRHLQEKIHQRIILDPGHTYLVYEHFGDENKSEFYGCKGDHYHILVDDRKDGQTVSATATYSYFKRIQRRTTPLLDFSAMQVDRFKSYVAYLNQPPRKLTMWSQRLDKAVGEGQFNIPWLENRQQFQPGKKKYSDGDEQNEQKKLTRAEKLYERLVTLVTISNARDTRQFIDWGMRQTDPNLRTEICIKYFSKPNFEKQVQKALDMINMSNNQNTWEEALRVCTVPSSCRMTTERSLDFIERFCQWNHIQPEEFAMEIKNVVDRTSGKINTLLFKGPSNAGKSKIANSIKFAFRTYADIQQGITNNFWLEAALGKRIILHEEAQFSEENQEKLKLLMEGAATMVARKGRPDAYLDRTPYMITCNTWPWCRFLQNEHRQAFINRCLIYKVKTAPWMAEFSEEGDLDPRAWLCIIARAVTKDLHRTDTDSYNDSDTEADEEVEEITSSMITQPPTPETNKHRAELEEAENPPCKKKLHFTTKGEDSDWDCDCHSPYNPEATPRTPPNTPDNTAEAIAEHNRLLKIYGGGGTAQDYEDMPCDQLSPSISPMEEEFMAKLSDSFQCSCGCEDCPEQNEDIPSGISSETESEEDMVPPTPTPQPELPPIKTQDQAPILSGQGFLIKPHIWEEYLQLANKELIFHEITPDKYTDTGYQDILHKVAKELFDIDFAKKHNIQINFKVSNVGYLAALTSGIATRKDLDSD